MASIYPSTTSTTSTSSSTSSANLLRIPGMASGIDTDAMVKAMVSNYQLKIDKANQDKQVLQWKQDGYRDIIKGIKELQEYFDPISSKYILSGNSFNTNSINSADSSKVSATVSPSAKAGTYKVDVTQLAEQAKIPGSSLNSMVEVTDLANWSGKTLKFSDGSSINLGNIAGAPTSTLMSNLVTDINQKIASDPLASGLKGKISATYVNDGGKSYIKFVNTSATPITLSKADSTVTEITSDLKINSGISSTSKLKSDLGFSIGIGAINFTVNDKVVKLDVTDTTTVQNLMNEVNSATGGAVTMNIDDTTGKISFQSKNSGSTSSFTITDNTAVPALPDTTTNNVIKRLGLGAAPGTVTGTGKDAIVAITAPGQTNSTITTQSSNQFTSNGINYNLVSNGSSSVTVTSNTDTAVSNVNKFIEDYNSLISNINTKLTEKKNSDYKPLTDAQKESMSETQIATWEKKAKVGILRNDDYLNNLLTQLRGTFSPVYSSYTNSTTNTKISLNFGNYGTGAIGIDTTKEADGGMLVVKDEAKLKSAIENNFEDFKKLFIGASSESLDTTKSYVGSKKYMEDGIFKRMDTIIKEYVSSPGLGKDGTYTLSGTMNIFVNKQYDNSRTGSSGKNTLPDQVYNKALSITKFQTQLSDAQTRYYAKFTALETAMNTLNAQQSQLGSMLGTS